MVRRDQLKNFLPRDRLASLAELEHLRHTLALVRDTSTPALDRPMTALPTLEADLDAGGSGFVLNDLAPPIWIDTPDSPSFADSTPEQSRNAWIDWLTKQDRERPVPRQFIERWRAKGWPYLGATSAIQTISKEVDRISNIVADRPARFNIVDNTYDSGEPPWYADDEFGLDEVRKHD